MRCRILVGKRDGKAALRIHRDTIKVDLRNLV
jgi:hypothetical protein